MTYACMHAVVVIAWERRYVYISLGKKICISYTIDTYTTLNRDWKRITRANTFLCKNVSL